jgi:hypothetical protein
MHGAPGRGAAIPSARLRTGTRSLTGADVYLLRQARSRTLTALTAEHVQLRVICFAVPILVADALCAPRVTQLAGLSSGRGVRGSRVKNRVLSKLCYPTL